MPVVTAGTSVRHARTVSLLAIAEVAGKVASFVMFAVAARVLGPADFGEFSWSFNLALLVSSFVLWGFDTALIQLASNRRDQLDSLLTNLLVLRAALTLPALVVITLIPGGSSDSLTVTVVLSLAVLLDSSNQAIRSAAAVLEKQRAVAVNLVVQRLATAGLAIAVLYAGGGVLGMSWAYLAGTVVGVVLMFWTGHRIGLRPSLRLTRRSELGVLLHSSTALGLSNALNMLTFRMDALMLGWILDTTAVGSYTAAYKLFETVLFVLWSLDRVALPAMAATTGAEPVRKGVHHTCNAMFAIYVPYIVITVLRGQEILTLVFGASYGTDSLQSLQILSLVLIPYGLQYLIAAGLLARDHNSLVMISSAIALAVNVVGNLILIQALGVPGAAVATFIAMAVQALFLWVALLRVAGSPRVIRSSLVPVAAGAAMAVPLLTGLPLIPGAILAVVVYGGMWFVLAGFFDREAKSTLLGMIGIGR